MKKNRSRPPVLRSCMNFYAHNACIHNVAVRTCQIFHDAFCRLLRSARYYLEKDRKDKFGALRIDTNCASYTNETGGLHFSKDAVKVQKK